MLEMGQPEKAIEIYEYIHENSIHPRYLGMAIAQYLDGHHEKGLEYYGMELENNANLLSDDKLSRTYSDDARKLVRKIKRKYHRKRKIKKQ